MSELELTRTQYLELEKLGQGAFHPVTGFMTEDEFRSVRTAMRLPDGQVFPLPIVLQTTPETAARIKGVSRVTLLFDGVEVGELSPVSIYRPDMAGAARDIYGTDERAHPGVRFFMDAGDVFVGGPVKLTARIRLDVADWELTPEQTRSMFRARGWTTVAGFQTRNIPHRGHEYLQRIALEICDGLFIQPLVGQKKEGDFAPAAIMAAYQTLIDDYYPGDNVVLGILSTAMRYAGPREAVFHATGGREIGSHLPSSMFSPDALSAYTKLILYFSPKFLITSSTYWTRCRKLVYAQNSIHSYFIKRHNISIRFNSGEYSGR